MRRSLLAPAAVLTVALAGCGTAAGAGAPGADAGPPRPGGTLTVAVASDQGCADPQQVKSNDSIYSLRQVVDSLTDQDPRSGAIVPWLATRWSSNPQATAWTFTLRRGATFSDGSPVDAAAVKANLDRVPKLGARGTLAKGYLAGYAGTDVVAPDRFTVRFTKPNVQFLQGTSTHSLGLLSPASAARSDDERCAGVVGSGPFVIESYVKDQTTVLARRPGYAWGSPLFTHPGEAYLDHAEFRVVPESGVRAGSLQSGEVDVIASVGQQDEAPLAAAGVAMPARPNPGLPFGITFNQASPLGKDPAVREAVTRGIDRDQVVGAVFPSQTKVATGPLASTTPYWTDRSAAIRFDPARAARVLDAAGWVPGPDGVRVRGGQRLVVPVTWAQNAATNRPALELVQQQLRGIGIEVDLQEKQISELDGIQQSGNFVALWGNLTRADPDILRSQFSSAGVNFYRFPPGPLDAPLTAQAAAVDPRKRAAAAARAQQILADDHRVAPVAELTTVLGVAPTAHDVAFDASSRIQLHDTWKSEE
ncbi:ABC transporter substrate-binding protein [Pseudonocardia phyllosphaerae]|uniref:ABC transporter substrate-binding protein n=1 Tax=Pseudonocardia phyllosphaerae TaxID=3390502 RepID=UPI00397A6014